MVKMVNIFFNKKEPKLLEENKTILLFIPTYQYPIMDVLEPISSTL